MNHIGFIGYNLIGINRKLEMLIEEKENQISFWRKFGRAKEAWWMASL